MASTGEVLWRNIYTGGHFLSVREGETARKGLRTSPRSPLVVFLLRHCVLWRKS